MGLVLSGTVKPPPAPYSLVSSIGQPLVEGGGFLGTSGCRPINRSVPSPITLTQQVIASGGNLRSSTGYRLGDTTGESLASGVNVATSADYVLSSGFWAQTTIKVENQHTIYLPLVLRK